VDIDWAHETTLDENLNPKLITISPHNIFLTGATGFLGIYLLFELLQQPSFGTATIFCLVRKPADRLISKFEEFCKDRHFPLDDSKQNRIKMIEGDLAEPKFGLSEEQWNNLCEGIDTIIHNVS